MGLFDIFKKTGKQAPQSNVEPLDGESQKNDTILAMVMYNNNEGYNLNELVQNLKNTWGIVATNVEGSNGVEGFFVDGEYIAFMHMDVQIPWNDIEFTAKYAYNWPKAVQDLENHNRHVIVTMMSGKKNRKERLTILSKVLCSIFMISNAVGVYKGSQSLLISKKEYLSNIDKIKNGKIPVSLWIYIGLKKADEGNSAYTYGLKQFQKQEFEVVNSTAELEELYNMLYNLSSYIIGNNVILKHGETMGYTEDQKIKILSSEGILVEGESLKLVI